MKKMEYNDVKNPKKVIQKLKSFKTIKEMLDLIADMYPKWMVAIGEEYCKDYPSLDKSWEKFRKENKIKQKAAILIVSHVPVRDKKQKIIQFMCDTLTYAGFVVRRNQEFTYCRVCNRFMPTKVLYDIMKERKLPVPHRHQLQCVDC